MKYFNIIDCIYSISEIFLFVRNLFKSKFYPFDTKIDISIELNNMQNRKLHHFDPRRIPMLDNYICRISDVKLEKAIIFYKDTSVYLDMATELITEIYKSFNWFNSPMQIIKQVQQELVKRSID